MRLNVLLFDAVQNLKGWRLQSILAIMGIAISSIALSTHLLISKGAEATAEQYMGQHPNAMAIHLQATDRKNMTPVLFKKLDDALKSKYLIAPVSMLGGQIHTVGKYINSTIIASDAAFLDLYTGDTQQWKNILNSNDKKCLVGADIPLCKGDVVLIGMTPCTIAGVLPKTDFNALVNIDLNRVVLLPYDAQVRFTSERYTDMLWINPILQPASAEEVLATLNAVLGKRPRTVMNAQRIAEGMRKSANVLLTALKAMGAIALSGAVLNLFNLLMLLAHARKTEFAIRQVIGASVKDIASLILMESAVLIGLGTAIGVVIGVVISNWICSNWGWMLPPLMSLWKIFVLSAFAGLAACLLPIRQVLKEDIVTQLQP